MLVRQEEAVAYKKNEDRYKAFDNEMKEIFKYEWHKEGIAVAGQNSGSRFRSGRCGEVDRNKPARL